MCIYFDTPGNEYYKINFSFLKMNIIFLAPSVCNSVSLLLFSAGADRMFICSHCSVTILFKT